MYFLLSHCIECFSTAAVLLPCFVLLHGCCFRRLSHTLWCYALALYWGTVYVLTGLPTIYFITFDLNIYLIPFAGFFNDLGNSILNMLLFIPMGLLLPTLNENCRNRKNVLIIGFWVSLGIEFGQLFTYRVSDINDLITNTLGNFLGYLLYTRFRPAPKAQLSGSELTVTAATAILAMFFLQQTLAGYLLRLTF